MHFFLEHPVVIYKSIKGSSMRTWSGTIKSVQGYHRDFWSDQGCTRVIPKLVTVNLAVALHTHQVKPCSYETLTSYTTTSGTAPNLPLIIVAPPVLRTFQILTFSHPNKKFPHTSKSSYIDFDSWIMCLSCTLLFKADFCHWTRFKKD